MNKHLNSTTLSLCVAGTLTLCGLALADGPRDNDSSRVRRIPQLGIEVPADERRQLERLLAKLTDKLAALDHSDVAEVKDLVTDVAIFQRAVRDALNHQEFFSKEDVARGLELLRAGIHRADELATGNAPWAAATGLVVRGYRSRIDHSVQPYGLVVPKSYTADGTDRVRLDIWFHGRGERLSEVSFLDQRMKRIGQFAPPDTIVLHPYGRYCNAFKFAGEVDVLEALEDVKRRYRIDEDRISVRGFSMGGAACWQFAVHYADRWFAANPGAGFSETPEFLRVFQKEVLNPTEYERKLWQMYDCTDYAANLKHCPTVAYSGELDQQKQAADIMETALAAENIRLTHIIGPQTKHRIHDGSKIEIEQKLAALARLGRQHTPHRVTLVTPTLKYNRMHWVTINALGEHWDMARVEATVSGPASIDVSVKNVTDLSIEFQSGEFPGALQKIPDITIRTAAGNTSRISSSDLPRLSSDRSWSCRVHATGSSWQVGPSSKSMLRKRHDSQGPIDDAFMDSFIFVRPSQPCRHPEVDRWVRAELDHAIVHWRQQFRGDARVKRDSEIDADDIASSNLVLFGDAAANSLVSRVVDQLPLKWSAREIALGSKKFQAESHVPVLIYPNPLNPDRYVVLNSGFTYREYDYLNNARQVPKLPDWAVVDVRTPVGPRYPGKIVAADFFDEHWELK